MNKLLTRQIKKYLPDDSLKSEELQNFINAIDRSYLNFENQFTMSQRATKISSDELYEANIKLREDAVNQKRIISSLNYVVKVLKLESPQNLDDVEESVDLVKFIDKQSNEILAANKIREDLLSNLELKNEDLNNYAHIVSHDLKTPLRSIDTLVNWVIEDEDNELTTDSKEHFDLILKNLEKMDALINGILNYSTIEKTELYSDEIKTFDLVDEIKQTFLFPNNIKFLVDEKLPIVLGDKFRLQQVFQNLIQNAMGSFDGEAGQVEVGVKSKDNEWEFFVSDTGKGIEEIYHERIFKIFESLENDINSSGIGLSIVKKIINFYGGKIWLNSEVDKGTTFYFTLPKAK